MHIQDTTRNNPQLQLGSLWRQPLTCLSWAPISGHGGLRVAAAAVQPQAWAPTAGGPLQKLQEGDLLLHPLTVEHWELDQWLQGEVFVLELEKE